MGLRFSNDPTLSTYDRECMDISLYYATFIESDDIEDLPRNSSLDSVRNARRNSVVSTLKRLGFQNVIKELHQTLIPVFIKVIMDLRLKPGSDLSSI